MTESTSDASPAADRADQTPAVQPEAHQDRTELELKFQVAPERRAELERTMAQAAPRTERLLAHYHDTADGCLAAHGIALRLRKEGAVWVQTLKAPGDSRIHRLEHNVPLRGRWGPEGPPVDIARHDGTTAARALRTALERGAGGAQAPLQRLFTTDVRRRSVLIEAPGSTVELAFDQGEIVAGERRTPVCEVEYELKHGSPAALVTLAQDAMREHGLWLSTISKAEQGMRLLQSGTDVPATRAQAPQLDRHMRGFEVVRATVRACLEQILANASEVASGRYGDEHVHQLRVGIRRLRTAFRELDTLADGADPAWEPVLVAVFRELGRYRDQETAVNAVRPQLEACGAPDIDWQAPAQAAADPVQTVRGAAFQAVLLQLIGFTLSEADPAADPSAKAVRKHVRRRLKALFGQVVRDGERFQALDEAHQHRVRKRLKRLRYLAEFVSLLYGRRAVERFLDRLQPAQDALGEHNDRLVAIGLYEHIAREHDPRAWYAVGWLRARADATTRACSRALRHVADAPPFW